MEERLAHLFQTLRDLVSRHKPHTAAIEETFVNANPGSALKLGMARGVVMMVPATFGLSVTEYAPNTVKKSLVGVGHADKTQMAFMVKRFLPGIVLTQADAGDALALAICHALHVTSPLAFSQTQPGRR
jgi:crossover junction endodeoxyribonuclease RuvC